ncbi:MAG: helix-turn-helix domain-containing protein, partial [Desulfosarcinaceae bacterium]
MTTPSEKPKDFGRYLQAQRIRQGISLDAISRLTRITKDILKQIESEDMARLPAPVFVKGFLKAYCEAVDLDKDEALARYEANLQDSREADQVQGGRQKQTPLFQKIILALVLLGAVIALTLYLAGSFSPQEGREGDTSSG